MNPRELRRRLYDLASRIERVKLEDDDEDDEDIDLLAIVFGSDSYNRLYAIADDLMELVLTLDGEIEATRERC